MAPLQRNHPNQLSPLVSEQVSSIEPDSVQRLGMSLRTKLFIILLTVVVVLMLGSYTILYTAQIASVVAIERTSMNTDLARVQQALKIRTDQLDSVLATMSLWDDTYNYVTTKDPTYIDQNFTSSGFQQFTTHAALIYDVHGKLIYGQSIDPQSFALSGVPTTLATYFNHDQRLLHFQNEQGRHSGILELDGQLIEIVSRPILHSNADGPTVGTIVFARQINTNEIEKIQAVTQFAITFEPLRTAIASHDQQALLMASAHISHTVAIPLGVQRIEGFGILDDIYNQPQVVARIEQPRVLYNEVQSGLRNLAIAFLLGGCMLFLTLAYSLDYLVLYRLFRLSSAVRAVGSEGMIDARIALAGNDELSQLSRSINQMLAALERAQVTNRAAERERLAALEQINAQLEMNLREQMRVEQLKNEFISVVSHELRTPLTAIRGALGLITGGVIGDIPLQANVILLIAQRNSERLIRLINAILDIEKIEAGKLSLQLQPHALRPLLVQAIEENDHYAIEHQICYQLNADYDTEVVIDRDRMLQVLNNLLSNAAKFSPAGETVTISLEVAAAVVRIAVTDRGPGIPAHFQQRVFQKFAQADASDARQKGGTGLGLSITRALVEQMSGTISFVCPPGAGTIFIVELPGQAPPTKVEAAIVAGSGLLHSPDR